MCRVKTWWTPIVRQTWVVSAMLINKFGQGMVLGVTSAMITDLQAPESPIKIDTDTTSWLVSSLALATLSGFPTVSLMMNIFGRKVAYCIKNIPAVIGVLLIGCGSNVIMLIIGRILVGITAGSTAMLGAMVVGEFTSPKHRGMFLTLKTAFFNLGSLFTHVLAPYIHWRTVTLISIIPSALAIAIALTWPESPSWLAEKKKHKESIESFYWLRGKTEQSTREIEEIIKSHQLTRETKSLKEVFINFVKKFKKRNFVKPFIITIFLALLLECSGRHVFPSYAAIIVKGMMTNDIDSFFCTIIIDILITISAFLSSYLIKIIKVRKLLFSTGIVSIVLLSLACLSHYFVVSSITAKSFGWVPIVFLSFYFVAVNLCCSSIALNLIGEIFPLEHRAVGTLTSGIVLNIVFAITLKGIPYLFVAFNINGTLLFFAGGLAISLLALYFMLPETKNKTLLDIEYFIVYGKDTEDDLGVDEVEVENKLLKNRSDI